ncbi:MAG: T9SS type A sorting domain-containing protein [bacterium]|nr:T9SS type A sorting domain-containing protein [bacterium]
MIVHVDSSLAASSAELPQDFTLRAFPNPFNSQVQLEYALPAPGDLRIEVFSVDGRLAAEVLVGRMSAGTHTLNWSPSNLASGTYIARMQTAATTRHLKLLYLK